MACDLAVPCGVHGYALAPPTTPSLFDVAAVPGVLASHTLGDVRDAECLKRAMHDARPDIVFHLAAQSLVRRSYADPVETYDVNVLGTVHLLEAVRTCPEVRAVVNVTTDKCYDNRGDGRPFREGDPLGGDDPYSSSKAAAELVTHSFRQSYLAAAGVSVASVRAGNVIGGGDWATDRLVPDVLRASDRGETLHVRHPGATRPWQYVLEPLSGYMVLAQRLFEGPPSGPGTVAAPWNFGPAPEDARPVGWLVERLAARLPGTLWRPDPAAGPHEAVLLQLDSQRARRELGWRPRWPLEEALARTVDWHLAWRHGETMREVCLAQIADYERIAAA
jgi:CDP-glucose 4,6-dehydratase